MPLGVCSHGSKFGTTYGLVSVTGSDLEKGSDSQTDLDSETGPVSGMVFYSRSGSDPMTRLDIRMGSESVMGLTSGWCWTLKQFHTSRQGQTLRKGQSQTRNLKGTGTGRWLHVLTVAMTYDTQVGMTMKPFRGRK